MDPLPITSLRPNVSRQEAQLELSAGWLGRLAHGPLRRLSDIYIPFRLYQVRVDDGRQDRTLLLAIDSVRGSFDSYAFDSVPSGLEIVDVRTRNHPVPVVSEGQTRAEALERARRLAYGRGFWRLRDLNLSAEIVLAEFYVPYWVGFYGRDEEASRLRVLDAVRRRLEGAKLCAYVREWLSGA